jgi:predicted amidohydrolase
VLAAAGAGAEVVVLPELVTTGYAFESAREARTLAERADGPCLGAIAALAAEHDLVIVGGFAELAEHDGVYNSAFLIDRSGLRAVYRKVHLWADERRWFTPGQGPAPVVNTHRGRIGILIVCRSCQTDLFPLCTSTTSQDRSGDQGRHTLTAE